MDEIRMEKVEDDVTVENMFGKSPLGLSKSKRHVPADDPSSERIASDRIKIDAKKKLVVDEDSEGERHVAPGGLPVFSTEEAGMPEEDLYGDLYVGNDDGSGHGNAGSGILRLKVSKLMSDVAAKDALISEADKVMQGLRETVSRLQEENETLKYNISSLFNTAKLEIERKDREIEENRSEIQRLKKKLGKS